MKTKNILAAMIIAAFAFTAVGAYAQETPAINIYHNGKTLKVVFAYQSDEPVTIDFFDDYGTFCSDKVESKGLEKGFIRHYKVLRPKQNEYWVNVRNSAVSARFHISTNSAGRLQSNLETVTYNQPIAKR